MRKSTELPIHHAIQKGFFQQVRFLADQGGDVNARDCDGRTPLMLCSIVANECWAVGLARLLLENGARVSVSDSRGYNALHHACISQQHQLVDVLLSALDCSALSRCRQGNTALHLAASIGRSDILKSLVRLLLRYKMKLDPKNKQGLTPLHQAFRSNNVDCGDMLMKSGADPEIKDPSNKSAHELRDEAIQRLTVISHLSPLVSSAASRTIRKIKKEATMHTPEPPTDQIKEAKPFDRRNDPEYVFNISAIDYFQQRLVKDIMDAKTKNPKRHTIAGSAGSAGSAWREDLLHMWTCYEMQNAESYRKPAKFVYCTDVRGILSHRGSSMLSATTATAARRHMKSDRIKSRAGSVSSVDGSHPQRRTSITASATSRLRNGMPPLVRTQSRAAFNIH